MNTRTGQFGTGGQARRSAPRALLALLFALATVASSGCTSLQTVRAPESQYAWAGVRPGDTVRLDLNDGRALRLDFVESKGQALVGRDKSGATIVVHHADIAAARVERFSAPRTAILGLAVATAVAVAAVANSDIAVWPAPPQ